MRRLNYQLLFKLAKERAEQVAALLYPKQDERERAQVRLTRRYYHEFTSGTPKRQ